MAKFDPFLSLDCARVEVCQILPSGNPGPLDKVVKLRLPPLFTRWAGRQGEEDKIKRFFQRQDGVVAVSEGQFEDHEIDVYR